MSSGEKMKGPAAAAAANLDPNNNKNTGIHTYEAPWPLYGMNWSNRRETRFRLAVGSFIEDYPNKVEIVQLDETTGRFYRNPKLSVEHPYPVTKIMFIPDKESQKTDLMATTGDYLRIWQIHDADEEAKKLELKSLLNNRPKDEYCVPLTSFDWSEVEPWRIATSGIDTTCTVWDIDKGVVDTQLIAHDNVVNDIAWGSGVAGSVAAAPVFASVSDDGSVRMFDLRDYRHSTILYESKPPQTPLIRLSWNKQDARYLATVQRHSNTVVLLDLRFPSVSVSELHSHHASVTSVAWAPHSKHHLCSVGDDFQALIWDTSAKQPDRELEPILAYSAGAEINQVQWSAAQSEWVAIAFANKLQILRVALPT
ncbi:unnamed protein product [Sphagnum balticum]